MTYETMRHLCQVVCISIVTTVEPKILIWNELSTRSLN